MDQQLVENVVRDSYLGIQKRLQRQFPSQPKEDIEDAISEAISHLLESDDNLESDGALANYLYVSAKNNVVNYIRSEQKEKSTADDFAYVLDAEIKRSFMQEDSAAEGTGLQSPHELWAISSAVKCLPEDEQIILFCWARHNVGKRDNEKPHWTKEAQSFLQDEVPSKTLRRRLNRAIEKLKRLVAEKIEREEIRLS